MNNAIYIMKILFTYYAEIKFIQATLSERKSSKAIQQ